MFEKVKLICLNHTDKPEELESEVILSKGQIDTMLLIGMGLPERILFEGSLKEFMQLFPVTDPDASKRTLNRYLEVGVAEYTPEKDPCWEFFTCRAAVLGCCVGFYLSIVNKKDLK